MHNTSLFTRLLYLCFIGGAQCGADSTYPCLQGIMFVHIDLSCSTSGRLATGATRARFPSSVSFKYERGARSLIDIVLIPEIRLYVCKRCF